MSFWKRRNGRVYVYTHIDGKDKQIPRIVTRHLDPCMDYSIDAWVKEYDGTPDIPTLPANLTPMLEQYIAYLRGRGKDYSTYMTHQSALVNLVFPFFLAQGKPCPHDWPDVSIHLLPWLQAQGCSNNQVVKCNAALRQFWAFHRRHKNIPPPYDLDLEFPPQKPSETPLKRLLTPTEALEFVSSTPHTDIKLMVLLGYFFSLRPQESLGVTVRDFDTDTAKECCKTMAGMGLYGTLAVHVSKQKTNRGIRNSVKAQSTGWVACFDKTAAGILAAIVDSMGDDEPLFAYAANRGFDRWRDHGIPDMTLKDLRRASLYWLGHYTQLTYVMLRHHARHRDERTTWLYMRRKEDGPGNAPRKRLAS